MVHNLLSIMHFYETVRYAIIYFFHEAPYYQIFWIWKVRNSFKHHPPSHCLKHSVYYFIIFLRTRSNTAKSGPDKKNLKNTAQIFFPPSLIYYHPSHLSCTVTFFFTFFCSFPLLFHLFYKLQLVSFFPPWMNNSATKSSS